MGKASRAKRRQHRGDWSFGHSPKALRDNGVDSVQLLEKHGMARRSPWHKRRWQLVGVKELTPEAGAEIMRQARAMERLAPKLPPLYDDVAMNAIWQSFSSQVQQQFQRKPIGFDAIYKRSRVV